MAGPMGRYDYVSDDGTTYAMRLDASNATAVGADAATVANGFPKGWVPRYVLAQSPNTGRQRRIVVPDPTAALWTANGGTVTIRDFATNADAAFVLRGRVGEKRYHRAM